MGNRQHDGVVGVELRDEALVNQMRNIPSGTFALPRWSGDERLVSDAMGVTLIRFQARDGYTERTIVLAGGHTLEVHGNSHVVRATVTAIADPADGATWTVYYRGARVVSTVDDPEPEGARIIGTIRSTIRNGAIRRTDNETSPDTI